MTRRAKSWPSDSKKAPRVFPRVRRGHLSLLVGAICGMICAEAQDLKPLPPEKIDPYARLVREVLLGPDSPAVWMICRPSFQKEYAVAIDQNGRAEAEVIASTARSMIWRMRETREVDHAMPDWKQDADGS